MRLAQHVLEFRQVLPFSLVDLLAGGTKTVACQGQLLDCDGRLKWFWELLDVLVLLALKVSLVLGLVLVIGFGLRLVFGDALENVALFGHLGDRSDLGKQFINYKLYRLVFRIY